MGEKFGPVGLVVFSSLGLHQVLTWHIEKRQERAKVDAESEGLHPPAASVEGTPIPPDASHRTSAEPTSTSGGLVPPSNQDAGNETEDQGQQTAANKNAKDSHPPAKKYRLTDAMKSHIWQLVCLSNEVVRLENEKK